MIEENNNTLNTNSDLQKKISLSVFMPFYNEEDNVKKAVDTVVSFLKSQPNLTQFEVIIVDDGSTDKTREIARTLINLHENVRLVSHIENIGYGGAIATGIRSSQYEYVFFTDGDLQFNIADMQKLFAYIREYDAVIGYRTKRQDSLPRIINAFVWNWMNRLFYGLHVKDINCAFKLFKREVVAPLPLISEGAMISSEILIRLKKARVAFIEVPVTHLPRLHGKPTGANLSVIFRAGVEFILLYKDILNSKKTN